MWKQDSVWFSVSSKIKPVDQKQKLILGACVETGHGFFSFKQNKTSRAETETDSRALCGNRADPVLCESLDDNS